MVTIHLNSTPWQKSIVIFIWYAPEWIQSGASSPLLSLSCVREDMRHQHDKQEGKSFMLLWLRRSWAIRVKDESALVNYSMALIKWHFRDLHLGNQIITIIIIPWRMWHKLNFCGNSWSHSGASFSGCRQTDTMETCRVRLLGFARLSSCWWLWLTSNGSGRTLIARICCGIMFCPPQWPGNVLRIKACVIKLGRGN